VRAGGHRTKLEYSVAEDTGQFRTLMDGAPAVKDWAADTAFPAEAARALPPPPAPAIHGARGTAALPQGSLGAAKSMGMAPPSPPSPPPVVPSGPSGTALPAMKSGAVSTSMPATRSKRAEATAQAASALLASLQLPAVTDGPEATPGSAGADPTPTASGERGPQVTTLSRTVGELTPPGAPAIRSRTRTLVWLAAGGTCLMLVAFLMIDPRGGPPPPAGAPRGISASQPRTPPPDRPAPAPPTPTTTGPVIERLDTGTARPAPTPPPPPTPPRRPPTARSNTIADPRAPVQKQPSPASRRKPKLFEDL
jgi:hypothetical protein